jgi:hypothetical protein
MDEAEGLLGRFIPYALLCAYAWAWAKGAGGAHSAVYSLALASFLITLPFFGLLALQGLLGGKMLLLIATVIGLLIPGLNFLVGLVVLLLLMAKLASLFESLPFILVGLFLYFLTWLAPAPAFGLLSGIGLPAGLASLIVGGLGGGIFWFFLRAVRDSGRSEARAAAVALGFSCFLLFFILLPIGGDGDSSNA